MNSALAFLVAAIVVAPFLGCMTLALVAWFGVKLGERPVSTIVGVASSIAVACSLSALVGLLATGLPRVEVDFGTWFAVGEYHFEWSLVADRLSLPMALFTSTLTGLIGAFSQRYLHRETGFFRFYFLLSLFGAGVQIVTLSGGLDQLFFGWELVGLTSAMLIAFFHERPKPVEHGLRAFLTYRVCDVGLLVALVWMHHSVGSTSFLAEGDGWSGLPTPAKAGDVAIVGAMLLWASMGKSAQAPLGGWLPRAMEGPTPSSAIFYGAISIHLGPYLLLRASPLLQQNPALGWAVMLVGAITALHGSFVGRVQTDIKSLLAYASMTQVGIIFVEIGAGLHYVPLFHIMGHATIRSLEILRSPSLLHDHRHLEQAVGRQVPQTPIHIERAFPEAVRPWLYRHALERGYFDALLRGIVMRFLSLFRWFDRVDRGVYSLVSGERSAKSEGGERP